MSSELWYKKRPEEVMDELKVDSNKGLSKEEVEERKEKYGLNELEGQERITLFQRFINQFKDFMVIILIVAAIVSGFLGEFKDAIIITAIILLNAILGLVQENKAEESLKALKNMSKPMAKVIRNGSIIEMKSEEIVPGDILVLEAGDYIAADGILIESASLKVEESALTGESVPVNKELSIPEGEDVPIGDRKNMVYSTSLVTNGRGKVIVTETGMSTEIGKIAKMIESQDDLQTPLQKKLEELGKWLGAIALVVCGIIFLIGYFQGREVFEMFMLAVSLAVAAIPEGLPAIITIVLSLGVQRMIKKHAIIRKLPAVETLGTASVICSDKTGTLTQNKMTVTKLYTYDRLIDSEDLNIENKDEKMAVMTGLMCNDASIEEDNGEKKTIGDPTEVALIVLGQKNGLYRKELEMGMQRVNEVPFDSDRKMMSTIHNINDRYRVYTKGAIDVILERCKGILIGDEIKEITEVQKKKIIEENKSMAEKALRILGLAYKDISDIPEYINSNTIEKDLIFVGMSGMIDPPREEVKLSVSECKRAGIKPVMITGDYKITAISIAKELGILDDEGEAIEGQEIEKMTDEELADNIEKYSIYARVSPEHKVKIVKAWQSHDKVVAMTGDGVNDAPALKRANIGCAMGITGTDVSKEASDMILTDDNFSTIVSAVEEGRSIFDNIKKSIHYLLSCNVGEIVALFISLVIGLPTPLLPIHILWINLITDSFPALALGVDPPEKGIMDRKPRESKESIFAHGLGLSIFIKGIVIGLVTIFAFNIGRKTSVETGRTMALITLALSQFANSFTVRSLDKSIFKTGLFTNKYLIGAILLSGILLFSVVFIPPLREIFELANLNGTHWMYVILLPLVSMTISEVIKKIRN
ncbi:calcium-translocating P-type ATPase, SERCA-type [Clostridium sp. D2Q-14]|uniref:calcium-translocating P-type ATPase, SERCA-type n=1 Tax=Anaeromonas gelatinilytica TaxID=2683194 RepID=UPI00193C646B|nr:calcium-translocating P-type ATPase, SERCA-type [Anaeromonas gelatinilytica]MBS4535806.1 calcium-translocating P-type ATPase, SERCA-type [Anaeromonas gelatinilytica]